MRSRLAELGFQQNFKLLRPAKSYEYSSDSHALPATSSYVAIARVQQSEDSLAERTRMCTLTSRALELVPGTARIASPSALNCARPARDSLFTSRAPPARDDVMATSVHSLTAPLVCACARSK